MTEINLNTKNNNNNKNLPSMNWVETTLGKVVKIGRGSSPRPIQNYIVEKKGIPWVKIADATASPNRYIEKTKEFIKEEGRSTSVAPGDLIVSNSATPGVPKFMKIEACVHDGWLVFSDYKNIDKLYLYYFFLDYRIRLERSAFGTVFKNLTTEIVRSVPIFLPPLPEQKAIASVLSAFDDKIEILREENKILEEIGKTIYKEWFGKYSVEKPEELPEGWRVAKITEIINREPVPYKCDRKDLDSKGKTPIIDQGVDGLYGYTSRDPDFVATKDNPVILFTNHTCNFWFIDYPFCAIQNVLPYRGKDGYDEYFLYFMTKGSITFIEYKGHWPNFVAKDFVIPSVEIAQNFSEIVKPILEKISDNNSQIKSLTRSRDEILPKLMSGIIRVNDFNSN
jgi:type I restriction enzyme S subunit